MTTQTYYRLSTGGGTAPLAPLYLFTADEIRSWAARQTKCLTDADRAALRGDVEAALAAGGGSGSVGAFSHGRAAGASVVRWRIERVVPTGPDHYGYLVAGGVCRFVGRPPESIEMYRAAYHDYIPSMRGPIATGVTFIDGEYTDRDLAWRAAQAAGVAAGIAAPAVIILHRPRAGAAWLDVHGRPWTHAPDCGGCTSGHHHSSHAAL